MIRHSAIYVGQVRHRRLSPVKHAFRFPLFMMYLDLAELPELTRRRWPLIGTVPALAWFRRADHFGDPTVPLDESVRELVAQRTGHRPSGPIRVLTHLRYLGHCFNPISLFYVFHPDGERVHTVVAEVSNTPWGERHCYVLANPEQEPAADGEAPGLPSSKSMLDFRFDKTFHVSPFIGMDYTYRLRMRAPGKWLSVHLENLRGGRSDFDATLQLERRAFTTPGFATVLARYPAMTLRVLGAIYWQAFKLWRKGAPYHSHPVGKRPHLGEVSDGRAVVSD